MVTKRKAPLGERPWWRWVTGLPVAGGPAPGDLVQDRVAWRARRAGWRHAAVVAGVCVAVEWATDPGGLLVAVYAAVGAAGLLAGEWWWGRSHYREYVAPMYHRLRAAGVPLEGHPTRHLVVPLDRQEVVVKLPPHWHAPDQVVEQAGKVIAATVGMGGDPVVSRHLTGRRRHLSVAPAPMPPGRVKLAAILPAVEASAQWHIVLGLGRGNVPVGFQIAGTDSNPHGLMNGPSSEAGKSTTAKLVGAQWLRHGGGMIILDPAGLSHPWAHTFTDGGLPNVVVVRDIPDIAAMLVWLCGEMDRRVQVGLYAQRRSGAIEADLGVKILVCLEEMNSLMIDLKDYPESVEALLKLVCRGRHMGIHVMILAQRAEARTLAGKYGGQVRENLGWKLLGRGTTPATLKFVAEGLPYPPGGVTGPEGRYGAVIGRAWTDVQVAYLTNQEAWDLATSGTVVSLPAGMPVPELPSGLGATALQQQQPRVGALAGETLPPEAVALEAVAPPTPPDDLVSLAEYAAAAGTKLSTLRSWRSRHRDRGFPEPAGLRAAQGGSEDLFHAADLDEWTKAR